MQSIAIPQIKFGKRKERSQMCELLTDDGRWLDKEYPALYGCVSDEDTRTAYLINDKNQYKAEDGNWHQLISEKSQVPICLREASRYQDGDNDEKELSDTGDSLVNLTIQRAKADQFDRAEQSESWNKIVWIISIVCGTVLLVVAIRYFGG